MLNRHREICAGRPNDTSDERNCDNLFGKALHPELLRPQSPGSIDSSDVSFREFCQNKINLMSMPIKIINRLTEIPSIQISLQSLFLRACPETYISAIPTCHPDSRDTYVTTTAPFAFTQAIRI
jgi:hypothetical protein